MPWKQNAKDRDPEANVITLSAVDGKERSALHPIASVLMAV